MLRWSAVPWNYRHPKKIANDFPSDAYARSADGVVVCIERLFETAIARATSMVNITFETVSCTAVCIDREFKGLERRNVHGLEPKADVIAVTVYPPERGIPGPGGPRQNDVYTLRLGFYKPHDNPYYSDDREILAPRLLHSAHKAWVDAWNLMVEVQGHTRPKWPVKFWIHGRPNEVYVLTDDDRLELDPTHPPIDENIIKAQEVIPMT
jgi:hypothetical protein